MRRTLTLLLSGWAAALLAGCEATPVVEFITPRIRMHVEGKKIRDVESISGDVRVERVDETLYRVHETGRVRIVMTLADTHTVDVSGDRIRVHEVEVESKGEMRDVFIEKEKLIGGVHPDSRKGP